MTPVRSRWRRGVLVVAILLVALMLALWAARRPIAGRVVDRELARVGVPARYRIVDLGFGRQRLADVVIGDPTRPDLVADWIELRSGWSLAGPAVIGIRAGRVRLRARWIAGRLSLGSLDRLLPAPSGKPFALPRIDLNAGDAGIRLETPAGIVGLSLAGRGRLDDGFAGRVTAVGERLAAGDCVADRARATLEVRISDGRPSLTGPIRAAALRCGGARATSPVVTATASLGAGLDRWRGSARVSTGALRTAPARMESLSGKVSFAGTARETAGMVDLVAADLDVPGYGAVRGFAVRGRYGVQGAAARFTGRLLASNAALTPAVTRSIAAGRYLASATAIAALAAKAARAGAAAARRFDVDATAALRLRGGHGVIAVSRLIASSPSGARVILGGHGVAIGWPGARARVDGELRVGGGGLPAATIRLAQAAPGAALTGRAAISPYAAGDARLELGPVEVAATPGGATRIAARATLTGPLGGGRVEALSLPLAIGWDGDGRWVVNPGCAPLSFRRVTLAGLALAPARLTICPTGAALIQVARGRVAGGARIAAPRLAGRLGASPLTLAAREAVVRLGDRGLTLAGLAASLGAGDRATRLEVARLDGSLDGGGAAGGFAGAAGRIGQVPLLLSDAAGRWTFSAGALSLAGTLAVADAAADARFRPLAARDVRLTLVDNRVAATATLATPDGARQVATVALAHDLTAGSGSADLSVAGLAFDEGFQPERLTPLTFGVIADVRGAVSGAGRIAWTPAGVTSTGSFRTEAIDLAAAFGPVTGLAGEIRFADLLNLESAPGQVATIRSVNPGIAVNDGVIRYRTLPGSRVAVEQGRWPFAGGTLTLEPSTLDFSRSTPRALTFRVDGVAADQFLQQFDFKNLDATGTFDGVLPMIFDDAGGRIENGRLAVREDEAGGGGTIRYVGELSKENLGTWGNIAFQALRSLRYRSLTLAMNGPLAGEMVTDVRFAGVSQGAGARANFLVRRLQRLPFIFNIRIRAPFRGLIDSARSFYEPGRLVERNLRPLLDQQNRRAPPPEPAPPIQPPASRTVP